MKIKQHTAIMVNYNIAVNEKGKLSDIPCSCSPPTE